MTITIDLPADIEARLRADAEVEGKDTATVAADRLAAWYEGVEPEAVAAIAQALADLEGGDRGMPLEDYIAGVRARRATPKEKAAA